MDTSTKSRGFASMASEKQREIARKGGKAAHEKGTAHEFTAEEARAAGRKGGERVSADRSHMSRIGRLGGKNSAGLRQAAGGEAAEKHKADHAFAATEASDKTAGDTHGSHQAHPAA